MDLHNKFIDTLLLELSCLQIFVPLDYCWPRVTTEIIILTVKVDLHTNLWSISKYGFIMFTNLSGLMTDLRFDPSKQPLNSIDHGRIFVVSKVGLYTVKEVLVLVAMFTRFKTWTSVEHKWPQNYTNNIHSFLYQSGSTEFIYQYGASTHQMGGGGWVISTLLYVL